MQPTQEQQNNMSPVQDGRDTLVRALAGTGKAQPLDEIVITPNGHTTMGEVHIGDYVISEEGKPILVIDTITTPDLEMYEVRFSDGSSTRCCKDHLWRINRKTRVNKESKMVSEVRTLSYMLPLVTKYRSKPNKFAYPYSIDVCKPVEFSGQSIEIDAYFLGYFLGNGHSSERGNSCRLSLHEGDVLEIKGKLKLQGIHESQQKSKSYDIHYSVELNKLLSVYGLCSVKSLNKFIPVEYKYNSIDNRIALLRGLMDSDGTCRNNKARFSTSSKQLAEDMVQLIRSLGGRATLSSQKREGRDNLEYNINLRTPFNPFSLARKATEYKVLSKDINNRNSIVDIVYIGKQTGKCLVVDSENHLYLTRDYLVTHNSSNARQMAIANPDKQFLCLCFNKDNANESNNHPQKPNNIIYSTVHAVAYKDVVSGTGLKSKLSPYLNYKDIDVEFFEKSGMLDHAKDIKQKKEFSWILTKVIQDTVTKYCRSDSRRILNFAQTAYTHIFTQGTVLEKGSSDDVAIPKEYPILTSTQIELLADYTRDYWLNLIDEKTSYRITHDVYLKLFHLRDFVISSVWDDTKKSYVDIDVLILDEAQDSNPVTIAIFEHAKCQKVVLGDENQQMYKWRGAENAMEYFADKGTYVEGTLTTSFRFNQTIADKANEVLALTGTDLRLIGAGTKEVVKTKAVLFRSNAALLAYAFQCAENEIPFYTSADLDDLFSKLYHISDIHFGKKPLYPNRALKDITSKGDLEAAMAISDDLKRLQNLAITISTHGGSLHNGILTIKKFRTDEFDAKVTLSTIHKSKGLEWDDVEIHSSLIPCDRDEDGVPVVKDEDIEEFFAEIENIYLLYVAITRARVRVSVPSYIEEHLNDYFTDSRYML